ncbi:MAG: hypothetical protein U0326_21210 [Polyangiales bacterium]
MDATNQGTTVSEGQHVIATVRFVAESGLPNKPMVPSAPTSRIANPLHPLRRHIGQPFGNDDERR